MADIDPNVECIDCGHMGAEHADTDAGAHTGGCGVENCNCSGMSTGAGDDVSDDTPSQTPSGDGDGGGGGQMGAIGYTKTDTTDGPWDGPAAEKALGDDPSEEQLHACYAWVDSSGDPKAKSSYKFPHHEVTDGNVGAANTSACSDIIGILNGGRGGSDIPADDKKGVYDHVAGHLRDAGKDVPPADFAADPKALAAELNLAYATGNTSRASQIIVALAAQPLEVFAVPPVDAGDDEPTPDEKPEDDDAGSPGYLEFEMPIMVIEGADTGDGRYIDQGVLTWRDLPLPVMGILKTTMGHDEAELVGRLDSIARIDISKDTNPKTGQPYGEGITALQAKGVFTNRDNAQDIAELVREGFIRGVSVDLGDVSSEIEFVDKDGNVVEDDDSGILDLFLFTADDETLADADGDDDGDTPEDDPDKEEDEDDEVRMRERMTAGRVMGVTICPFPAFEGAYIKLSDGAESPRVAPEGVLASGGINILDVAHERTCKPCEEGLVASAAAPMYPPSEWFAMPEPDEVTPMTITDDGRVFGHIAGWQTCHTGITGKCVLAPRSQNDYANFHVGALKTAEGDIIPVGHLTLGTGHADLTLNAREALAHYDNTGTVVASVVAHNGRHGIWFSGTLEPDVDELTIRRLRGAALSGDWRPVGRGLELLAVLAVNTPGFPIERKPRARVASAQVQALVAAGMVHRAEEAPAAPAPAIPAELVSELKEFMGYVYEKDTEAVRARMSAARATVTEKVESLAAQQRARVHKS